MNVGLSEEASVGLKEGDAVGSKLTVGMVDIVGDGEGCKDKVGIWDEVGSAVGGDEGLGENDGLYEGLADGE